MMGRHAAILGKVIVSGSIRKRAHIFGTLAGMTRTFARTIFFLALSISSSSAT